MLPPASRCAGDPTACEPGYTAGVILHPVPDGWVAVPQSAHALLAFQIADHWGNRTTPRPSPRPDVLAAVLLHDAGWDDREEPLRLAADGAPLAFDTWPESEREPLWAGSVERAAQRGRYVAYLVSHHVSHLAACVSSSPHAVFLAAQEQRRAELRADLAADPRYRDILSGPGDASNRDIVRISDAIAVHVIRGLTAVTMLAGRSHGEGAQDLELKPAGPVTVRLRPWPMSGARLVVHAEGRRLPTRRFASASALQAAWAAAPTVRLSWSLLAPGAPA